MLFFTLKSSTLSLKGCVWDFQAGSEGRGSHFLQISMKYDTKIDCTHFFSVSFANVPLLQKWPVLGAVSHSALHL